MKITCLVLSLVLLLFNSGLARADICDDIDKIYRNAKQGFKAWKGAYDQDFEKTPQSSFVLPQADHCFVEGTTEQKYGFRRVTYGCTWVTKDLQAASAWYENLVSSVSKCSIDPRSGQPSLRSYITASRVVTTFSFTTYAAAKVSGPRTSQGGSFIDFSFSYLYKR